MEYLRYGQLYAWVIFPAAVFLPLFGFRMIAIYLIFAIPLAIIGQFWIAKSGKLSGGLFHPSANGVKDDKAIIAGMYNLARGHLQTSEHLKAEKEYLEILKEYPDEMDAHYYLGTLYGEKFNKPEKALMHFKRLNRKIIDGGVDYQYHDSVREKIKDLGHGMGKS